MSTVTPARVYVCQCEGLVAEIEQLKEKVEELTVDCQLLKEDLESSS